MTTCMGTTQDYNLCKLRSTWGQDTTCYVSRQSAERFWRRRCLKFLPYMGTMAILVMWPILNMQPFVPHTVKATNRIWLKSAQRFQRKSLLKYEQTIHDWPFARLIKWKMTLTSRIHSNWSWLHRAQEKCTKMHFPAFSILKPLGPYLVLS